MSTSLHTNLQALAAQFTDQVLEAIRSASLDELLGESRGSSRPAARAPAGAATRPQAARAAKSGGRLPRRSAEDLSNVVGQIVALLKTRKDGLRAEQIREELGIDRKELPRPLKVGLEAKKLLSKGQKRATTYFAR
jgi:hypothetical protein